MRIGSLLPFYHSNTLMAILMIVFWNGDNLRIRLYRTCTIGGLPDYDLALRQALAGVDAISDTQTVEPAEASGRVLATPIIADRDMPSFNRAMLDGYALRASDLGHVESFPVAATIAAGRPADVAVGPGQCVAIATGAPLPEGVDTVIGHEQSDRGDPVRFTIDHVEPGHAVHPRGGDAAAGDTLLAAGTVLGARHLGIAAAVGADRLEVVRRPRAVLLTSGDEIVGRGDEVATHQVRNSNGPMIVNLLGRIGTGPVVHRHVTDDRAETVDAVGTAISDADLVVTVGGISAGDRDYFPDALETHGVTLSVHGAAIQPGRPVIVGRVGRTVVVGLPGNPVSALACTCLFVWPIVRALLGLDPVLPWRTVELAEPVSANARRRAFRPAILVRHNDRNDRVRVPAWAGSGDLAHTATTDGLLELPVTGDIVVAATPLRFLAWP